MTDKRALMSGAVLIVLGALLLIGNLTGIRMWALLWPGSLIAVGAWMILRPRMIGPDTALEQRVLGNIAREDAWQVRDEEFWLGVGDVRLDLTGAEIPDGETKLRFFGFVGDIQIVVPEGVGVSVTSSAVLTDGKVLGREEDRLVSTLHVDSDDYDTAESKVRITATYFVVSLGVRRA